MILDRREKVAFIILLITAVTLFWHFYKGVSEVQNLSDNDPYSLIIPTPTALLSIHKTSTLENILKENNAVSSLINKHTPLTFLSLVIESPDINSFIISYHDHGELLYATMDSKRASKISNDLVKHYPFPAEERIYGEVLIRCYPDINNKYLCCYYHNGIFVASYDLNLLKKTIMRIDMNKNRELNTLKEIMREKEKERSLDLFIKNNDTWLVANIFHNNDGNICCYLEHQFDSKADSLLLSNLKDSISSKMEQLRLKTETTVEVDQDSTVAYVSICVQ